MIGQQTWAEIGDRVGRRAAAPRTMDVRPSGTMSSAAL
jgi:hypothetical protein